MCWTPLYANKHTKKNPIKHEPSYKQLEVKTNQTSFLIMVYIVQNESRSQWFPFNTTRCHNSITLL